MRWPDCFGFNNFLKIAVSGRFIQPSKRVVVQHECIGELLAKTAAKIRQRVVVRMRVAGDERGMARQAATAESSTSQSLLIST